MDNSAKMTENTEKSYKEDFLSDSQADPLSELIAKDRFYKKIEDNASSEVDYEKLNKQLDFTGSDKQGRETSANSTGRLMNDIEWNTLGDILESTEKRDYSIDANVKWNPFDESSVQELAGLNKADQDKRGVSEVGSYSRKPQSLTNAGTTTFSALQQEYRGVQRLECSKEISEDKQSSVRKGETSNVQNHDFGLKLFRIDDTEKTQLREMNEIMADLENFKDHTTNDCGVVPELKGPPVNWGNKRLDKITENNLEDLFSPSLTTKQRIARLIESLVSDCGSQAGVGERFELLKREMETQEDIIGEYQHDNVALREKLKNMQVEMQVQQRSQASQIGQLNRNISQFKSELEMRPQASCAKCGPVEEEICRLRTLLSEREANSEQGVKHYVQLQRSLEEAQRENKTLNETILTNMKIGTQTQQQKLILEETLSQSTTLVADLQGRLDQKTRQLASTRKKMGEAETTLESLRRRIFVLENELQQMSAKRPRSAPKGRIQGSKSDKEVDELRMAGSRFGANLKKMRDHLSSIRTCTDSLRSEISVLEKRTVDVQSCKNLRELQTQMNWRLGKLTQLFGRCESTASGEEGNEETEMKRPNEEPSKIAKALDNIKNTQDRVLERLRSQGGEMRANVVESHQATIELLEKKLTESQESYKQVAILRQSEARLLGEIEKLQASLANARRTQEPAAREFERLMTRVEQLEAQYDRAVAESDRLASELASVDDRWADHSHWTGLLAERDAKITNLRDHLGQIFEILQYVADQGVDISIPDQFRDYLK